MKSHLAHVIINVTPENLAFYRELMAFLGWSTLYDGHGHLGTSGANGSSVWFASVANGATNDYDGRGMNHIALGVDSIAAVDEVVKYLKDRGLALLFETPRHRAEFAADAGSTYYQVMFESPDKVLFEVVYGGPK